MLTELVPARVEHAAHITPATLAKWAIAAGWDTPSSPSAMDGIASVLMLPLGHQHITVRLLHPEPSEGASAAWLRIQEVLGDMENSFSIEQVLILDGFSAALEAQAWEAANRIRIRRIHVGSTAFFKEWVKERLGAVQGLPVGSRLRALVEPMLCVTLGRAVQFPPPPPPPPQESNIKDSFDKGYAGSLAIEYLLGLVLGRKNVVSLESDVRYQPLGIDLKVMAADMPVYVEVKTESYDNGNAAYEWTSNHIRKTPGWLRTSQCDLLVCVLWLTGDVFIQDFPAVKNWILANKERYPLKFGWSKGQTYKSQIYPIPLADVMQAVPNVVHLSLHDWLPGSIAGTGASLLKPKFIGRSIKPNRINLSF